jgi:hypothetical protein
MAGLTFPKEAGLRRKYLTIPEAQHQGQHQSQTASLPPAADNSAGYPPIGLRRVRKRPAKTLPLTRKNPNPTSLMPAEGCQLFGRRDPAAEGRENGFMVNFSFPFPAIKSVRRCAALGIIYGSPTATHPTIRSGTGPRTISIPEGHRTKRGPRQSPARNEYSSTLPEEKLSSS